MNMKNRKSIFLLLGSYFYTLAYPLTKHTLLVIG